MDAAAIDALSGQVGVDLFAELPTAYDPAQIFAVDARLRSLGYPAELIAAALTQWELRDRAAEKFGPAAQAMFFTRDGLEQSTRAQVADLHAERFAEAGARRVWDLGCGIGGDTSAFRRRGLDVTAVESDPLTASIARANAAVHTEPPPSSDTDTGSVQVRQARVEDVLGELRDSSHHHGVWVDPARRTPGVANASGRTRRVRSPDAMEPPWDVVLAATQTAAAAGVKVSAGFVPSRIAPDAQAQWISYNGQAVECALWWGTAAPAPGLRSAAVHDAGGWHHLVTDECERPLPDASTLAVQAGAYVYEVDPAVLAAGLRPQVCRELDGRPLGGAGYVLAQQAMDTPWARCLQIEEVLPISANALRAWARRNDVGPLTLKKPSAHSSSPLARLDPDALRRKVAPHGSTSATLLLTDIDASGASAALWVSPIS